MAISNRSKYIFYYSTGALFARIMFGEPSPRQLKITDKTFHKLLNKVAGSGTRVNACFFARNGGGFLPATLFLQLFFHHKIKNNGS